VSPAERTFVAVKPDGVQRGLVGEIISRFERRGLKLIGLKLLEVTPELAEQHYGEHMGKPFYEGLVKFITSGPVVAMVWEGKNAIHLARNVIGANMSFRRSVFETVGGFHDDVNEAQDAAAAQVTAQPSEPTPTEPPTP